MPKSATRTADGKVARGKLLRYFDAKAVIAEKDVADAGDQNARLLRASSAGFVPRRKRFDFRRIEEKAMARLSQQSQVASRIIVQHDTDMRLAFVVLFHALDGRDLSVQRDVENISAFLGKKTDAISRSHLDAGDRG